MSRKIRTHLLAAASLAASATVCSCVNDDYDMTKDFDNSFCIDGTINAPIGTSEPILLKDLLKFEGISAEELVEDANGDYSLRISGSCAEAKLPLPASSSEAIFYPGEIISVGSFPDFLCGDDVTLDLYDPQILLTLYNGSPVPTTLNIDIVARKRGNESSIHIGDEGSATEAIRLEASGTTKICVSRTGKNIPVGYKSIVVSNTAELLRAIPEYIGVSNITLRVDPKDYQPVHDKAYNFSCAYDIIAPLAFGKDLRFEYPYDITQWNEDFNGDDDGQSYEIKNADVTFNMVNMIPLGMELTVAAIDREGNVIPEIAASLSGEISSGSVRNPSTNPMSLNLKAASEHMKRLDGIRMNIKASGPGEKHLGVCFNKEQGIKLEDIKLKMQGSISLEL